MNNRKLFTVSLTILVAMALFAIAAPAVAAQDTGESLDSAGVADFGDVQYQPTEPIEIKSNHSINVTVEPTSVATSPGGETTLEIIVENATDGISAYNNVTLEFEDESVGNFTNFTETRDVGTSNTGIFNSTEFAGDGDNAVSSGPVFDMNAALSGSEFSGAQEIVLGTVTATATGELFDNTTLSFNSSFTPNIRDNTDSPAFYPLNNLGSSEYSVTFDMNVDFSGQKELQSDNSVVVNNVDSDGEQAALIVTYENDAGDLVIAGLQTGVYNNEDVNVVIQDTGGLSENASEVLTGDHTAHILPTSQLSGNYDIGDTVSAETAGNIIDDGTATVFSVPVVPLDEFDIVIDEGLTVGDEYPLNVRNMFPASNVYGLSGIPLPAEAEAPDERFAPIADGQHVGLTGLPVQDEVYHWVSDNGLLGFETAQQSVAVSTDPGDERDLTLDYSEAAAHGLEIASIDEIAYDNVDPANVTVTPQLSANQVVVSFAPNSLDPDQSPTIQFDLSFEAANPTEGLNVQRPNDIDYETDHRLTLPDGDQVRDNFVTFEAGATGISYDDVNNGNNGFIGESTEDVNLASIADDEDAASGTANDGSFLVWEGQVVTLETEEAGQTIDIFEATTTEQNGSQVYARGPEVSDDVLGFDDTAPGRVANLNTANLSAGEQYFVTFNGTTDNAVVLDVKELGLDATLPQTSVPSGEFDEPFEVSVSSSDTTGDSDIETWFYEAGTSGVGDVLHVERNVLTGNGDRGVEITPQVDLTSSERGNDTFLGQGEYYAVVLHAESGVTVATEQFELGPPEDPQIPADDVQIVTPSLEDPDEPGIFDRGDIMNVTVEFEGGNVGTVTFGDRDDQNVELNATIYDADNDGSATFYINTYQIGHGVLNDGTPNRPNWIAPADFENRQHGFFTNPANNDAQILGDVTAHPSIDIYGGSQGGAVLSAGQLQDGEYPGFRYDLHATGGFEPFTVDEDRTDVNALDIEQRSTDSFNFWTAPGEGSQAFDPAAETTAADYEDLASQGLLTQLDVEEIEGDFDDDDETEVRFEFNGTVAEEDYLIVQAQSSGLEGVMHEAIVREADNASQEATLVTDFYFDGSDDVITSEFTEALSREVPRIGPTNDELIDYELTLTETFESLNERVPEDLENIGDADPRQTILDPALESVVAGEDDADSLYNYYIPYKLDPGEEDAGDPLTGGQEFNLSTVLEPRGGAQEDVDPDIEPSIPESVNPPLSANSLGAYNVDRLDYVSAFVQFDGLVGGTLEVPRQDDYSISGISTMAPGTELTFRLITVTGEETPFLKTENALQTQRQPGAQPATWSFSKDFTETRDNTTILENTQFEVEVARTGTGLAPLVTPSGDKVPGVVLEDPAVDSFEFNDQNSNGDAVIVSAYEANRDSVIQLQDSAGNVLGESDVLARNTLHETFAVPFDEPLESNQDVTAVAIIEEPEDGQELASQTASIQVEEELPASFQVSGISPASATVEPGASLTVSATVENTGDVNDTQTISLSVGDSEVGTQELSLAGGASEEVSFDASAPQEASTYVHTIASADDSASGTLTVQAPAMFEVLSISPQEASVEQGASVSVSATVQNTGDAEGTQDVTLSVGALGDLESQSTTLAGGETTTVSFAAVDTSDVDPGSYTHAVSTADDTLEGSLTIQAPAPVFELSGLSPEEATADQNETVTVSVTVENTGGEGTQEVSLDVDGISDSQSVTLGAGESQEVSFDVDTSGVDAGDYTHTVSTANDSVEGSLTINGTESSSDGSGPGFGIVAAALALLGAALLALRREVQE